MENERQNLTEKHLENVKQPDSPIKAGKEIPPEYEQPWRPLLKIFLSDPTKFFVSILFILYFLGYATWHFYLARFGVSSMPFLQTEYISAAFCFLIVFVCLSVPPYIALKILVKNIKSSGLVGYKNWDQHWLYVLLAWYFVNSKLISVFLPNSALSHTGNVVLTCILYMFGVHILIGAFILILGGYGRQFHYGKEFKLSKLNERIRNSKLAKWGNPVFWFPAYLALFIFVGLWFNPDINTTFLVLTVFFWFFFSYVPGFDFKNTWPKSDILFRSVVCLGIFLYFILYVQTFATLQFGKFPKSVGGGKPEMAYFDAPEKGVNALQGMGVQKYSQCLTSTNLFGPVGIVLRTDNEILFLDTNDLNLKLTNTNKFSMRQIRSDLIDGIIFLK